ncbi:MAG: phage/plasmid primase, P4 family [Elusimicrobiota bacterium]|nr:phage/plasmid primase, P4 family [Elusimicrobiota bacterium]
MIDNDDARSEADELEWQRLMRTCELTSEHVADLKKSGIMPATAEAARLRGVDAIGLKRGIGFGVSAVKSAVLIPYAGTDFLRAKVFPPYVDKLGKRVKYLQPKETSPRLYLPPRSQARVGAADDILYVIEGEKKALAADQDGLCSVGIGGVYNWKAKSGGLIPDFDRVALDGREVRVVPDSDWRRNKHVGAAIRGLVAALEERGAEVSVVCLPDGAEKAGYDDFRLTHSLNDFLELERVGADEMGGKGKPECFEGKSFLPRVLADRLGRESTYLASPIDESGRGARLLLYKDGLFKAGEAAARTAAHAALAQHSKPDRIDSTLEMLSESVKTDGARLNHAALDLVNAGNGMLDWRTDALLPHSPGYLSTFQIAAAFDPQAECPDVDRFLAEVFPEDALLLAEEILGYLLLPTTKHQKAVMLFGPGSNGKSTFLSMTTALLGAENVSQTSLQALTENKFAVADLFGKTANICADLSSAALAESGVFKQIVGGDVVRAEHKFQPAFTFRPYARLLFSANELPYSADHTTAFFRRWIVVPFLRSFEGKTADKDILAKLTTPSALSRLLNRALAGLQRLEERGGFTTCESVEQATEKYRRDCDNVYEFALENLERTPGAWLPREQVFNHYTHWAQKAGMQKPHAAKGFAKALASSFRLHEGRKYLGDGSRPHVWLDVAWKESSAVGTVNTGSATAPPRDRMDRVDPVQTHCESFSFLSHAEGEVETEKGCAGPGPAGPAVQTEPAWLLEH